MYRATFSEAGCQAIGMPKGQTFKSESAIALTHTLLVMFDGDFRLEPVGENALYFMARDKNIYYGEIKEVAE